MDIDSYISQHLIHGVAGKFQTDSKGYVDIVSTNKKIILGKLSDETWSMIAPADDRLARISINNQKPSNRKKIAVVVMSAGLSTRSSGVINPLCLVGKYTLLELQLNRIAPYSKSVIQVFVHTSHFNHKSITEHLKNKGLNAKTYYGCELPRLSFIQDNLGSPIYASPFSSNPGGHWEALRAFYDKGYLNQILDADLLLFFSFTNFGQIFSEQFEGFVENVYELLERNKNAIAIIESCARPTTKKTGSFVVRHDDSLALLKPHYGVENINSGSDKALMSTNTWWFSPKRLIQHLNHDMAGKNNCLSNVANHISEGFNGEKTTRFEAVFPIPPILSEKYVFNQKVIQLERDLDQLSLLAPKLVIPIEVPHDRAWSVKSTEQLNDFQNSLFNET